MKEEGRSKRCFFSGNASHEGTIDTQGVLTYGAEDERCAGMVISDFWLCADGPPHLFFGRKIIVLDDGIE